MEFVAPNINLPLHRDDIFWLIDNSDIVYLKPPTFIKRIYPNSADLSTSVVTKLDNSINSNN